MKRYKRLPAILCALTLIPYCFACSDDVGSTKPLKKYTPNNVSFDYEAPGTAEEIIIYSLNIFKGKVIDSSLELTENVPEAADWTLDFCAVYTVEVVENYKGTNSGVITVIGPQPYGRLEEKRAVLRENGYEPPTYDWYVCNGYEDLLETGKEYLFTLDEDNSAQLTDPFAFDPEDQSQYGRAEIYRKLKPLITGKKMPSVDFSIISPITGVVPNVFYTESGGVLVSAVSSVGLGCGCIEYLPPVDDIHIDSDRQNANDDFTLQTLHVGESTLTVYSENKEKCNYLRRTFKHEWMLEIDGVPARFVWFSEGEQVNLSELFADAEILSISDCISAN